MKLDGAHSSSNTLDTQLQAIRSKSKLYLNSFFVATSSWRLLTCAKREDVLVVFREHMRVWVIASIPPESYDFLGSSPAGSGFTTEPCVGVSARGRICLFSCLKRFPRKVRRWGVGGGGGVVGGIKVAKKDYRWSCRSLLGGYLSSTSAEFSTKE